MIGRFKLVREVGRGGFGIVYEALDRVDPPRDGGAVVEERKAAA